MKNALINVATVIVITIGVVAVPFVLGMLAGICVKGFNLIMSI